VWHMSRHPDRQTANSVTDDHARSRKTTAALSRAPSHMARLDLGSSLWHSGEVTPLRPMPMAW